jgi:hypothetical protein
MGGIIRYSPPSCAAPGRQLPWPPLRADRGPLARWCEPLPPTSSPFSKTWTARATSAGSNEFSFEEVIAGRLLKKNVVFTRIEEGVRLESIREHHYRIIAEIFFRIGPLAARLNRRELDAVREHMRVEGIDLKRFVESRHESAGAGRAHDRSTAASRR